MRVYQQRQAVRNSVRIKRTIALALGLVLISMTIHIGSVQADDLDDKQLARTSGADQGKLADGFTLSFDAKSVINSETDGSEATKLRRSHDRREDDAPVVLHGVHKLEISLYPDDFRPRPSAERDPFASAGGR